VQIIENKALLFKTRNPQKYSIIPKHKVMQVGDGYEVAVYWGLDEVRVLRNLGVKDVPSPITKRYDWPGRYKPMQHQIDTAAFLTMHRRSFVFSEPGTGKTLSARAVANRTDACFIRVIGSELIQKYTGEGARMVRELFQLARSKKACIIFFDEVDAIGGARGESADGTDATSTLLGRGTFEIQLVPGANMLEQQISLPLSEVPQGAAASIRLTLSMTHGEGVELSGGGSATAPGGLEPDDSVPSASSAGWVAASSLPWAAAWPPDSSCRG
jgi:hypothetical protein